MGLIFQECQDGKGISYQQAAMVFSKDNSWTGAVAGRIAANTTDAAL